MRSEELEEAVTELVNATFEDDVAAAIIDDEAFGALCGKLRVATYGGDYDRIDGLLTDVANSLNDSTLDWLVDQASNPAAFIASKI